MSSGIQQVARRGSQTVVKRSRDAHGSRFSRRIIRGDLRGNSNTSPRGSRGRVFAFPSGSPRIRKHELRELNSERDRNERKADRRTDREGEKEKDKERERKRCALFILAKSSNKQRFLIFSFLPFHLSLFLLATETSAQLNYRGFKRLPLRSPDNPSQTTRRKLICIRCRLTNFAESARLSV